MSTTAPTLAAAIAFVSDKASERDLDAIIDAIKSRRGVLRAAAAAAVAEQAMVTIVNIKPKYLDGLSGVVKTIIRDGRTRPHATITLDSASTRRLATASPRFYHLASADSFDLSGIPLSCCEISGS